MKRLDKFNLTSELFQKKQINGMKFGLYFRLILILITSILRPLLEASVVENYFILGLNALLLSIFFIGIIAIYRNFNINIISNIITVFDISMMALFPFFWYVESGYYESTPSVVLLKGAFPFISIILVCLSGLSLDPKRPLIMTFVFNLIFFTILLAVISDPRTQFTDNMIESVIHEPVYVSYYIIHFFSISFAGIIVSFIVYTYKRTIGEAIELELESFKLKLMDEDLENAKETQKSLINIDSILQEKFKIETYYRPYDKIGGDFLSAQKMNDDKSDFIFGDVSGHGIGAAMISGMISLSFKSLKDSKQTPKDKIEVMDQDLKQFSIDHNISLAVFRISEQDKEIQYSYAGHGEGFILRDKELKPLIGRGTLILSPLPNNHSNFQVNFEKGDWIFFFSDGLYEVFNSTGEMMDYDNYLKFIQRQLPINDPKTFLKIIANNSLSFSQNKISDDMTMLLVGI